MADVSTLKRNLRLSGVPSTNDADVMIAGAIEKARIVIYDRLGDARITAIKATATIENPTTPDQLTRVRANRLEIDLVRQFLMRTMPVVLRDERSQGKGQSWNDEGMDRDMDAETQSREISRLGTDIEEAFESLVAGEADNSVMHVSVIGPPCTNRRPGQAVFG